MLLESNQQDWFFRLHVLSKIVSKDVIVGQNALFIFLFFVNSKHYRQSNPYFAKTADSCRNVLIKSQLTTVFAYLNHGHQAKAIPKHLKLIPFSLMSFVGLRR